MRSNELKLEIQLISLLLSVGVRGLVQPFLGSVGPGHFLPREVDLLQLLHLLVLPLLVQDVVVIEISIALVPVQPFPSLVPHFKLVVVFNLLEILDF